YCYSRLTKVLPTVLRPAIHYSSVAHILSSSTRGRSKRPSHLETPFSENRYGYAPHRKVALRPTISLLPCINNRIPSSRNSHRLIALVSGLFLLRGRRLQTGVQLSDYR